MNNKDYLNQIASDTRSTKSASGLLGGLGFSPKMVKIIIGAIIAAILIIIIGLIAGGSGDSDTDRDIVDRLYIRSKTVSSLIDKNNSRIKAPELRSMLGSLKAVTSELNSKLNTALKEDFGAESPDKPAKESTATSETDYTNLLTQNLDNARISGTLDRVMTREMLYNISMMLAMEQDIIVTTKYQSLREYLTSSQASLTQLQTQFDNYSAK